MFYSVKIVFYSVIVLSVELQFSACISLTQEENNGIANNPFKLLCKVKTTIINVVTIRSPDNTVVVSCTPAIHIPPVAAACLSSGVYTGLIDETASTVAVTTHTLPGDFIGTWSCTHGTSVSTLALPNPIPSRITLTQEEYNVIANNPLKLVCNLETTISNAVTVRSPDNTAVISCTPTIPFPPSPATCSSSGVYTGFIDETTNTVIVTTSSLPGNVNGSWSCTHGSSVATLVFPSPIPCFVSENFVLSPNSLSRNVTRDTRAFSLSATYSCINVDITFKWILKAGTSHEFTSSSVSKDSSSCTNTGTCIGANAYTQTISSESIFQFATAQNLQGGYELSAETHYSNGITALKSHSIGYFEFSVLV